MRDDWNYSDCVGHGDSGYRGPDNTNWSTGVKPATPIYWAVPAYAMRVGPGSDAVVWKICDTNETVEL